MSEHSKWFTGKKWLLSSLHPKCANRVFVEHIGCVHPKCCISSVTRYAHIEWNFVTRNVTFRVKHFEWFFTFKVLHIEWNQNIVTNHNLTRVSKMKDINKKRYYIFLNESIFLHVSSIQSYKCNHFKVFLETMKQFC